MILIKIKDPGVRLLWTNSWWDGPLAGLLIFSNKHLYFKIVKEKYNKIGRWRKFALYHLTEEQMEEENYWHELFCKHVGTHNNFNEKGEREGKLLPQTNWHKFYNEYPNKEPLILNHISIVGFMVEQCEND